MEILRVEENLNNSLIIFHISEKDNCTSALTEVQFQRRNAKILEPKIPTRSATPGRTVLPRAQKIRADNPEPKFLWDRRKNLRRKKRSLFEIVRTERGGWRQNRRNERVTSAHSLAHAPIAQKKSCPISDSSILLNFAGNTHLHCIQAALSSRF